MIDRSQFLAEIQRNPAILNRIAAIVYGEVGNATVEKQMIQAESIFNRAIARGQSLEEVTRTISQGRGYYPDQTLTRGEKAMSNPATFAQFRDKILRPVIGGSDVGTEKLKFAPTGNASDSGLNKYGEPYATGRAARGEYARTRWYQGGEKSGGKLDEMYVQEKGSLDKNERIDALRKGGPQPESDPNSAMRPSETPRSTGNLLADHVAGTPFEPTPEQQSALVTGVPSEPTPPVSPATPAPAAASQTQSARAPAAAAPAYKPKGFPGSRDDLPYDYIDPNTGHRIVNPKGSGETAMGITRDLGPLPAMVKTAAHIARPAAVSASADTPAKPPTKAEELSPRVKTGDVFETGAPAMTGSPLVSQSTADALPSSVPRVPLFDVPPTLPDAGPRPFDRAPFDQSAMNPTPLPQQRSIDMGPYKDEGPTPLGAITGGAPGAAAVAAMAPPQADFLSTLFQNLSRTPARPLGAPPPDTGTPLSPFEPGGRSASFPFAPAQARSPVSSAGNEPLTLPKFLEDPSAARNFGGTRPLNLAPPRTNDQQLMGLSPFAPRPGASEPTRMAAPTDVPGGSATQPTPQQVSMQTMGADPMRDTSVDMAQLNLSPFQEWPPPWWGDGGFGGGGGFDFGGGGGWGGGGWGGEGFSGYGDFSSFA